MKDFIEGIELARKKGYITSKDARLKIKEFIEITLDMNRKLTK